MRLALKIDVDTYDGMRDGVPNFLKLFRELGIQASFYVPFGPDESGKAVFRVFKKKGFLKKMFRSNALKLYGMKTMLRGTLLPAPLIGSSFPELARRTIDEGHELGIHGYNHVEWQDHLLEMSEGQVRRHLELGISSYEKAVGSKPRAFAAPAWLCSPASLRLVDSLGFDYASDTRGRSPFFPSMEGENFKTLQIPSTLPTLDELLGREGMTPENVHRRLTWEIEHSDLELQVHSIHTEVEGTALFGPFSEWVRELKGKGAEFVRLDRRAAELRKSPKRVPRCEIFLGELPGRAGTVACQTVPS